VTIIETPPMIGIGVVGYIETPNGLRAIGTVWAQHISDSAKRRFYRRWYSSKRKAFTRYQKRVTKNRDKYFTKRLEKLRKRAQVVRLIAHTQPNKVRLGFKKAHLLEVQVNGGTAAQKVDFAVGLFEKPIAIGDVFKQNELIDTIGVTKGHGFEGVVTRWGVRHLPRKTHRGLRKVACIGAWHPAGIQWTVARAGQRGFHNRTEVNRKVYVIGKGARRENGNKVQTSCTTGSDLTKKGISPMGGFTHYGAVMEDYIMLRGSVMGSHRRPITLRKSLRPTTTRDAIEEITLKWVNTSSGQGHGRFQTVREKKKLMGPMKSK